MTRDDELRLHAYLDGELGPTESIELERRLGQDPELRAGLAELRSISERIRGQAHYYAAPPLLEARIGQRVRGQISPRSALAWRWSPWVGAAAVAAAAAWFVPGWVRPASDGFDSFVQQALDDHLRANFSAHWVDVASSDRHTVKPWLSAHLGFSPAVPDLSDQGFELVGARLDVIDSRPVAALVYRRRQHTISVFVWPGQAAPEQRLSERQGYQIIQWGARGFCYGAVSDLNRGELRDFSRVLAASS